jgi:hypothetical protein
MKQSIQWHRECFKNWSDSISRSLAIQEKNRASLSENQKRLDFYAHQITQAEIAKKDGFDSERFLVKQKANQSEQPTWTVHWTSDDGLTPFSQINEHTNTNN